MNLKFSLLMGFKYTFLFLLFFGSNHFWLQDSPVQAPKESSEGIVLIGNQTGFNSMNWKQIKSFFRGEKSFWASGTPITVVLPGNSLPYSAEVASKVYGTTPAGVQKFWLSLVFQGRSKPPVFLNSEEEIIRYVSQNSGAIGFVTSASKSRCAEYVIQVIDR
jgi:hypothetical protein